MKSLAEHLKEADEKKVAIGHFNISELSALRAIFGTAQKLNVPVLIGTSEGERNYIGPKQAVALVKSLREQYDYPIFINADHTHSLEKVKEAALAGYDEILFDGSFMGFEENLRQTKQAVEIVKSINPNIVVEGEIGYIGASSEIVDKIPEESLVLSTPEHAKKFVEETKVDVIAPAVGNMHGLLKKMLTGEVHKRLHIHVIDEIKQATGIYMTLHGGSGTDDNDFRKAVKAGMTIVHVSTELRVAWRRSLDDTLKRDQMEVAPYKLLTPGIADIAKIVENRLRLFNSP